MKKRVIYFDILKAIAILFVILIHAVSEHWDTLNVNSGSFVSLSLLDSISRFCVPVYFMISGAIFLNEEKNITIKDILKKYIPRILLIFIFWNMAYSLIYNYINDRVIDFAFVSKTFLHTLLGEGVFHLYFLPIIIGFYLCVPLLRKITTKDNRNILLYLIILLTIVFGSERLLLYFFDASVSYTLLFGGYLIYFILGYYLNTFDINKKNTNIIYILGIGGLLITFLGTIITSRVNGITDVFFKYDTFNVILYSSCIFLFAKNNFKKINDKLLSVLSKTNFGIYLIHGLVLGGLEYIGVFNKLDSTSITLSVILNTILIYIISIISVFILIKIPFIRRLVSLEKR